MANGDQPVVYTNCLVTLQIDGVAEADGMNKLLFNSFTPPSWSTEAPKHKFFNGKLVETVHGGTINESWSPMQLGRGVDTAYTLYKWVEQVRQKPLEEAKKTVTVTVKTQDDQGVHVWIGEGAVITQYGHSAHNAATNETIIESVSIDAEKWRMADSGGSDIAPLS
jgi:phage tail-like protein